MENMNLTVQLNDTQMALDMTEAELMETQMNLTEAQDDLTMEQMLTQQLMDQNDELMQQLMLKENPLKI